MKLTRRKLLVGAATLAAGTCVGVRGFHYPDAAHFGGLTHLSPRAGVILAAIVDTLLPPAARPPDALVALVRTIDGFLAGVPAHDRDQLLQGLYAVEHGTLPFGTHVARFTSLDHAGRTDVLTAWQTSRIAKCRLCYRSLKALAFLAHYRDAAAFAPIRYPGPALPGGGGTAEVRARYAALAAPPGARPRFARPA